MKNVSHVELDDIDRRLIALLTANARQSNAELAEAVGIAQSTCLNRVRNLLQRGVIRGFMADVNPQALGLGLQVLISVTLRAGARQQLSQFLQEMRELPEVVQMFFLGGAEDFIIHLAVEDSDHVQRFVLANLSGNPAVANTRTNLVFEHFHKGPLA